MSDDNHIGDDSNNKDVDVDADAADLAPTLPSLPPPDSSSCSDGDGSDGSCSDVEEDIIPIPVPNKVPRKQSRTGPRPRGHVIR